MPRILLTNDDGVDAPGLEALRAAVEELGEALTVAPSGPRSGSGHSVTTHDPLQLVPLGADRFALDGTPADCARLGLLCLAPDAAWVFSGINRGGNLGADTYISGTVAAAREATFLGYKALAVSQYVHPELTLDWARTARLARAVIESLLALPLGPREFWNVNLPHLPEGAPTPAIVHCGLDACPLDVAFASEGKREPIDRERAASGALRVQFTGNYHGRQRDVGRDVDVCFGGAVAVTRVPLDIAR